MSEIYAETPKPRFGIGQKVWTAAVSDEQIEAECPDCMGAQKWKAVSPAGEEFEFPCPRCQGGDRWKLRHQKAVYTLRQLTIGSVRIDSNANGDKVEYMCAETGVGTGSVWRESRLGADKAEAHMIGKIAVAEREAWRQEQIERADRNAGGPGMQGLLETRLRYHTFETAEIARAKSESFFARYRLENLCNAIAELDDYGGIEGLNEPTLERIVAQLADTTPLVRDCREAVLHDRERKRKAA